MEPDAFSCLVPVPPIEAGRSWDVYAPWDSSEVMAPQETLCPSLCCDGSHRPLPDGPSLAASAARYVACSWQQGSELWKNRNLSARWWVITITDFFCVAWNSYVCWFILLLQKWAVTVSINPKLSCYVRLNDLCYMEQQSVVPIGKYPACSETGL